MGSLPSAAGGINSDSEKGECSPPSGEPIFSIRAGYQARAEKGQVESRDDVGRVRATEARAGNERTIASLSSGLVPRPTSPSKYVSLSLAVTAGRCSSAFELAAVSQRRRSQPGGSATRRSRHERNKCFLSSSVLGPPISGSPSPFALNAFVTPTLSQIPRGFSRCDPWWFQVLEGRDLGG